MIWCSNYRNVHIHTFRKRWTFIWECFLPVSILKPFTKIIKLSLDRFWLPVLRVAFIFLDFLSEKSDRRSCNEESGFQRFTVSIAENCLLETVNNESNTNHWTFEFEIKQSNIMTNSNKKNIDHWTLEHDQIRLTYFDTYICQGTILDTKVYF